jgi:hypothetical protein
LDLVDKLNAERRPPKIPTAGALYRRYRTAVGHDFPYPEMAIDPRIDVWLVNYISSFIVENPMLYSIDLQEQVF